MVDPVQTIFTYEVPAAKWRELCEQISKRYRGKEAQVRRSEPGAEHPDSDELLVTSPLQEVQFDVERVQILVDSGSSASRTIDVAQPTSLRVEQHGDQGPGQLRLQRGKEVFVLRFEQPFMPELLRNLS